MTWLVLLCSMMLWMGCSNRRLRPGFCRDDCTNKWEPDCETLCSIPQPQGGEESGEMPSTNPDASTDDRFAGEPNKPGATRPGSDDEQGDAGSMQQEGDCGPRCSDTLCDRERLTCSPCTSDGQCNESFPYCGDDGVCVGCKTHEHCEGVTPYCEPTERSCVQCMNHEQCDSAYDGQCLDNRCVPCSADEHCSNPDTPVCNGRQCKGCETNADCRRFGKELGVCEKDSGRCVQCTDEDNDTCCSPGSDLCIPTVCDNRDHTCSDQLPKSAKPCEECVSDLQCGQDHVCVTQRFDTDPTAGVQLDELDGHYCLPKVEVDVEAEDQDSCYEDHAPFIQKELGIATISGDMVDICTLRRSTCPAFTTHEYRNDACDTMESVPDHSVCGYEGLDDSRCVLQETAGTTRIYVCKMVCLIDEDCRSDYRCTGSDGAKTCEPG